MNAITVTDHLDWPPYGTVFPVSRIDLRVGEGEHPFRRAEAAAVAENWQREHAANPALYDGEMILQQRLRIGDGEISADGFLTRFSTFLWWRKQAVPGSGYHLFGLPVPVSSDGAIIAIRMAAHTANGGEVYCAAGSLDRSDIVDGRCDLFANMAREVAEETGLDLGHARADDNVHAFHLDRRVTVFRLYHFDLTAEEMLERIAAHMLVAEEQEIDGGVAIRSGDPAIHAYSPAMRTMLGWYFGRPD